MIAALNQDPGLTIPQAAEYLGKKPQTLQNWRSQGRGPAYIKGRPIMYRVSDLEAWIEQNRVEPIR